MIKKDLGFSGLEAAIVMIAFVVVAAFFGVSVMTSGFFAAEQSEKTTMGGYKQASASTYIEGGVYATLNTDPTDRYLKDVTFSIGILETSSPQDLSKMHIIYTHSKDIEIIRDYSYGGTNPVGDQFKVEGGAIMLPGSKRTITLPDVHGPVPGGWFSIEVKPQLGSPTFVKYYLNDAFTGGLVLQ